MRGLGRGGCACCVYQCGLSFRVISFSGWTHSDTSDTTFAVNALAFNGVLAPTTKGPARFLGVACDVTISHRASSLVDLKQRALDAR